MGKKKTKQQLQAEVHLTQVANAYRDGYRSLRQIAAVTGLSKTNVGVHMQTLREEWARRREVTFATALEEEIAELDEVAKEAWAEWQRSKQPAVREVHREKDVVLKDGDAGISVPATEVTNETITQHQCGDGKYLDIIKDCIEKRCRLRGLSAERGEMQLTAEYRVAGQTPDEVNASMLIRLAGRIQQRLASGPASTPAE